MRWNRSVRGLATRIAWVGLVLATPSVTPLAVGHAGGTQPPAGAPPATVSLPVTRTVEVVDTLFGVPVPDPYRWLEDAGSPEVKAWIEAQDRYARSRLEALPGRDSLMARLRELNYVESVSPPLHRGARFFYTRRHADREKAVLYWREEGNHEEHVLLDPNELAAGGVNVSLGTWVPSYDGRLLAYALHLNNADEATLYVREVATGRVSTTDVIPGAKYAEPSWTPDGSGFYYVWLPTDPAIPTAERPGYAEVRFHRLGTGPRRDPVIHGRTGNAATFLNVRLSRDGHWLFVGVDRGWSANDIYFCDARKMGDSWQTLVAGVDSLFQLFDWRDRFYVLTNDGAPRWRVMRADPAHPARAAWREIVREDSTRVLQEAQILGGRLVLGWLAHAESEIEIRDLDGGHAVPLALPEPGSGGGFTGNPDEDAAYYSFSSFLRPPEVYRASVASSRSELWAGVKVPVDRSPYAIEQVSYPSKDGTRVSMFIVGRRDMPRDGSTPFLLTGYGGFNVSRTSDFSGSLYAWLEAGGGFALPNLRGGSEYGEAWHRAGMLGAKQNVFDDFISAAEYLVGAGYTRPERLAIEGRSNGGLLVGTALTQKPGLFRAVVCGVPLLDMLRYQKFGSGKTWTPEYGSADNADDFRYLLAYSPYHHVQPGVNYPAVLFYSADKDDRVDPMHARKMAARLQAATGGDRPVLLWVEKEAGHGGSDQVRRVIERTTNSYAFLMHELGMKPAR